jgi:hypothetical protein
VDANKRSKLIEIDYKIRACGTCVYARIEPKVDWGTCTFHRYEHEKHTGPSRELSINRHGLCRDYEVNSTESRFLGGFTEFAK